MESTRLGTKLVSLLAVLAALIGGYLGIVRPWHRTWGSTEREQLATLPGDEIVQHPRPEATSTHAITIQAPMREVWPWIAQIGQDRGGFYSFEVLEDLAGCEMENADHLLPDRQTWQLGDKLWMLPPDKADGLGYVRLAHLEPGRALGFGTHQTGTAQTEPYDGSWSFALEPEGAHATRMLIRGRAGGTRSFGLRLFDVFVFEPMHFTMERRMMENIRLFAEGQQSSALADNLLVLSFTLVALLGLVSLVLMFRRAAWQRALLSLATSAIIFMWLTFGQPAPLLTLVAVLALARFVWRLWRSAPPASDYHAHVPAPVLSNSLH